MVGAPARRRRRRSRGAAGRAGRAGAPRVGGPCARGRAARRTRRWHRPSPRSNAQAYDGCRRSPYRITWRAAARRRGRGVAADRERAPAVRQPRRRRRGPRECAPSAPTTTRAAMRRRARTPSSATRDVAHPVPHQRRAGRDRALDQPGVEHLARDHPHRAGQRPATRGVAAGQLQRAAPAPSRRRRRRRRPGQHVEDVRGDAVAAALVAREVVAVEQQHPQAGGLRQGARARWPHRPDRRRRPRGPRCRAARHAAGSFPQRTEGA